MRNTKNLLINLAVVSSAILLSPPGFADITDKISNQRTEKTIEVRMLLKEGVPSQTVDAHVNKDIIQFAGFVDNIKEYRQVQAIGDKYKNDYRVINNVKVLPEKGNHHDEEQLRHDVRRHLKDHNFPADIDVQVRNGNVILSGFVSKNVPVQKLNHLSAQVPGVTKVDNYLLYKQV